MAKIYSNQDLTANQREWFRQKHKPSRCKKCQKHIVFMKNIHWNYVACDAVKKIVTETEGDRRIMQEDGIISTMGRRFGWPVHECEAKKISAAPAKGEGTIPQQSAPTITPSQQ